MVPGALRVCLVFPCSDTVSDRSLVSLASYGNEIAAALLLHFDRNSFAGQLNAPYAVGGMMAGVSLGGDTRPLNPGVRDRARPASAGVKHVWDQTPQVLPKAPPHALTNGEDQ